MKGRPGDFVRIRSKAIPESYGVIVHEAVAASRYEAEVMKFRRKDPTPRTWIVADNMDRPLHFNDYEFEVSEDGIIPAEPSNLLMVECPECGKSFYPDHYLCRKCRP